MSVTEIKLREKSSVEEGLRAAVNVVTEQWPSIEGFALVTFHKDNQFATAYDVTRLGMHAVDVPNAASARLSANIMASMMPQPKK